MRLKAKLFGAVLLFLFVSAGVVLFGLRKKQGDVESIGQLPNYGSEFPTGIQAGRVNYSYSPGNKRLLAATDVAPGEFMKICKHFNIEPLPYSNGFQDGTVTDVRYIPTNGFVYLAERKLYSDGRAVLRLFLQPSGDSRQAGGKLFIHVLD